jgi:hypothetical protein
MRSSARKRTPLIAGLMAGLLVAIVSVPLVAQPTTETRPPAKGFGADYDAAHETTLNGTIEKITTKREIGKPAGMHLLVSGPSGVVDAHVGYFLNKEAKESLQEGMPVKIVGAMSTIHGKSYLLARLVTVGDRTIRVRSKHGILAPEPTGTPHKRNSNRKPAVAVHGGAQ